MLILILFFFFFLPISYLYGWGLVRLIRLVFHLPGTPPATLLALTGMMALTTVGSILSFFIPLNGTALGIVLAGGLLILLWRLSRRSSTENAPIRGMPFFRRSRAAYKLSALSHVRKSHFLLWVLLALTSLSVLISAARQPSNPDSGIYHVQAIRWMETYPVVPGLANIHHRLGYNSSWLVLNALFSLAFLGGQSFHMVPAALFFLALVEFIRGAFAWVRGEVHPANILRTLLIPIAFYTQASEISSPGTDLPATLFLWLIVVFWLEHTLDGTGKPGLVGILLFALSIFTLTIKLSALPILIFAVILWGVSLRGKMGRKLAGVAAIILLPWLARNVVLSGYLVYPFPAIDLFHFDWKVPLEKAVNDQRAILAWARIPREDAGAVLALPPFEWMKIWFRALSANQKIILMVCGMSPLLLTIQVLLARKAQIISTKTLTSLVITYLIVFAGGVYWLFTAPDYRFGYGFLLLIVALILLVPLAWMSHLLFAQRYLPVFTIFILTVYQASFLVHAFRGAPLQQHLLLPIPYPSLRADPCQLRDVTVYCPAPTSYFECWYEPFPCIPSPRADVELRGPDFRDGFRYVP